MAGRWTTEADDPEIEVYLREIGTAIPAVARAVEHFGAEVLELWIARTTEALAHQARPGLPASG
jgi:hypothetical protein